MVYFYKFLLGWRVVSLALIPHIHIYIYCAYCCVFDNSDWLEEYWKVEISPSMFNPFTLLCLSKVWNLWFLLVLYVLFFVSLFFNFVHFYVSEFCVTSIFAYQYTLFLKGKLKPTSRRKIFLLC